LLLIYDSFIWLCNWAEVQINKVNEVVNEINENLSSLKFSSMLDSLCNQKNVVRLKIWESNVLNNDFDDVAEYDSDKRMINIDKSLEQEWDHHHLLIWKSQLEEQKKEFWSL